MKKKALLVVGLALMIAVAGVAYALWTDTLVMNVNVNTGTIDPQWSLAGTNDDGLNNGWDGEQVLSTVYTYGEATSNDPSGSYPPPDAITRVYSRTLSFGPTGWGGWSCPAGTTPVAGGAQDPDGSVPDYPYSYVLAKPGATLDGFTYPVFPHYTYPAGDEGIAVHNGNTGQSLILWIDCASPGTLVRYEKDVADCFAEGNNTDTLTVVLNNAYPSYWCTVKADLHNDGTVPVKLQSILITGGDPAVLDVVMPTFTCGYQLDPGMQMDFFGSFHAKNPVLQGTPYVISYTLNWVNYNEFVPASCSGF